MSPPHSYVTTLSTSSLGGASATGPWTGYAHYAHPAQHCAAHSLHTLCTAGLSSRPVLLPGFPQANPARSSGD